MKRILCPTDFSETAHNAIAYAAKFCQDTDSTMTLFNVQSLYSISPLEIISGKSQTLDLIGNQLEEQSNEVSQVFKISCDAKVQASMQVFSKVIEEQAENFDLIIMGTTGTNDLYTLLAGSNTYNAMRRSRIPGILIPKDYIYVPVNTILYAFNYLEKRKLPLAQLAPWIKKMKASLSILEITGDAHSKAVEADLKDIHHIMQTLYSEVPMTFESIISTETANSIHQYMIKKGADLLALCSAHRNLIGSMFHKSVIKSITAIATYPVFIAHE